MVQCRITLVLLLISFITVQCQNSSEYTNLEDLPAEVTESIERRISEGLTPGITLAIIDSSGVKFFNFGKTAKTGQEVNENTIYEIGSITKVFTGISTCATGPG